MTTTKQVQAPRWQGRIVKDPLILDDKPIVKGTRLSVEFITNELERGRTEADIIRDYSPNLTSEEIEASRQYKATGAKLSYTTWAMQDALMDGNITAEEFEALKKEQITWEELHTLKGGVTWAQLDALREGKITWAQLDDLRAGKITWEELDATMGNRYKMIWKNGNKIISASEEGL